MPLYLHHFLFNEIVKTMVTRQDALEVTGPSILVRAGNCICVFYTIHLFLIFFSSVLLQPSPLRMFNKL